MSDAAPLADSLTAILQKTKRWREDLEVIRALEQRATTHRAVSEQQLVSVEEISAAVYAEITAFNAMITGHGNPSELEATMIAEVGDVLRLLSLEITELSTRMYAARSAWALDNGTTDAPVPELADDDGNKAAPAGDGDVWR
jgi:hypothetical protein